MKKSSISLAILSSILLSACGGSNSNQSTSSEKNNPSTSNTDTNGSVSPSQPSPPTTMGYV